MSALFIALLTLASVVTTIFVESFHHFEAVAKVENATDTAAKISSSVYAKTYDQLERACMVEEMPAIPVCKKLKNLSACIDSHALACDEEMDPCLAAAQDVCSGHQDEFKSAATSDAQQAAQGVMSEIPDGELNLTFKETGTRATIDAQYLPVVPFGKSGTISRFAEAVVTP